MNKFKYILIAFVALLVGLSMIPSFAFGFIGPDTGQEAGTGGGLFDVDENRNIGFGTDSPSPLYGLEDENTSTVHGYILTVASSTNPGLGLYNTSANIRYVWSARNNGPLDLFRETSVDGRVFLRFTPYGRLIVNPSAYGWPTSGENFLMVGGAVDADSYSGSGVNLTSIDPQNFISGSAFASGNYAINGSLAVGTSTVTGLPYKGLYVDGNVGIGTMGPGQKLEIVGNIGVSSNAKIGSGTGYSNTGGPYAGTATLELYSGSTGNTTLLNNFGEIILLPTSNIGIGTTSPGYTLDVAGDINFTGTLYQNGSEFQTGYWETSGSDIYYNSGNVGVGTSTPQSDFHVVGGAIFSDPVTVGTPSLALHAATKNYVDSVVQPGGGGGLPAGSTEGQTLKWNNTTDSWNISSNLVNNGTNVGIGTTSPSQKLHVEGNIALKNGNKIIDADNSAKYLQFEDGSGYVDIQGYYGMTLGSINTGEIMRLKEGNVGIGTTSPGTKLDVAGGGTFSQPVTVGSPIDNSHAATKSYVDSAAGGGFTGSGTSNYITKWTGTESLGNSVIYDNGTNVGIGTDSPRGRLEVYNTATTSDANGSASMTYSGQDSIILYGHGGVSGQTYGSITWMGGSRRRAMITSETESTDSDHIGLAFYTQGADGPDDFYESMRISHDGQVGIGTTSPGYKLDVSGTGRFTQPVIVGTPTGDSHATTKSYVDSAASSGGQWTDAGSYIYANNASNVTVNDSGNVGIGTTSPLTKLHIKTDSANNILTMEKTTGSTLNSILFKTNGVKTFAITDSANDNGKLVIAGDEYGNNAKLTIQQDGNVGIGDSTPTYRLDVSGTGRFTQPVVVGTPTDNSHAATKSYVDSAAGGGVPTGTTGQTLYNSGGSWLASSNFYHDGTNVGIGTTSPGSKLDVSGTVTANSFSGALSAGNVSSGQFGSNTGGGNYSFPGNVGIGTTSPTTLLTLANDGWISAKNSAGDGVVNMFKVNTDDEIVVGGALNVGTIELAEDSGVVTLVNMPISSTPAAGTQESYSFSLDSDAVMTVYGEADGLGGVQNTRVGIGTITPSYNLEVAGSGSFTSPVIVGTPTADSHATTKSYVDSAITGGAADGSFDTLTSTGMTTLATNGTDTVSIGTSTTPVGVGVYVAGNTGDVVIEL